MSVVRASDSTSRLISDSIIAMVNRPPKPPCWRDFLPDGTSGKGGRTPRSGRSKNESSSRTKHDNIHFTDLSQLQKGTGHEPTTGPGAAASVVMANELSGLSSNASLKKHYQQQGSAVLSATLPSSLHKSHDKSHKKHKPRLHRTRSEFSIAKTDLPEIENMTVSLGEAKPGKEFGLRPGAGNIVFDVRSYREENARRCERWLEGVKASEPLEDIAFDQGTGVEIEVPDEETAGHQTHRSNPDLLSDFDSVSVDLAQPKARARASKARGRHRSRAKSGRQYSPTEQPPVIDRLNVSDSSPDLRRPPSTTSHQDPQEAKTSRTPRTEGDVRSISPVDVRYIREAGPPTSNDNTCIVSSRSSPGSSHITQEKQRTSVRRNSMTEAPRREQDCALHHSDIPGYVLSEREARVVSSSLET